MPGCGEIWQVGELLVTVVLASLMHRLVILQWGKNGERRDLRGRSSF